MTGLNNTKIIFFVDSTFNRRDYERFGIETLTNRGFAVEVWDFTPLLKPKYFNNYTPPDPINYLNHIVIHDKYKAKILLSQLNKTDIVVANMWIDDTNRFLFSFMSKNKINYGFLLVNTIPITVTDNPALIINRIKRILKNPETIISKLKTRIRGLLLPMPKSNFCIVGGTTSINIAKKRGYINDDTILIKAHTLDYDIFLEAEKLKSVDLLGNYVLMLDEYAPYHPDNFNTDREPDCVADTYYPQLNRFFEKLENSLGIKIIIAAHPRSHYEKMRNPFGGRKIILGQTAKLVKNAKLILAHASTSINYGVLYFKPIIFLSSSDYSLFYQHSIKAASQFLSKTPIDITQNFDIEPIDIFSIDDLAYKRYVELFIKTHDSPDKMLWEIFADYCNQQFVNFSFSQSSRDAKV